MWYRLRFDISSCVGSYRMSVWLSHRVEAVDLRFWLWWSSCSTTRYRRASEKGARCRGNGPNPLSGKREIHVCRSHSAQATLESRQSNLISTDLLECSFKAGVIRGFDLLFNPHASFVE